MVLAHAEAFLNASPSHHSHHSVHDPTYLQKVSVCLILSRQSGLTPHMASLHKKFLLVITSG